MIKQIITSAIAGAVASVIVAALILTGGPKSLGGQYNGTVTQTFDAGFDSRATSTATGLTLSGGQKVGSNGTTNYKIIDGNCTIVAYATTIAASSTATVDCSGSTTGLSVINSGITIGDNIFVTLASTTAYTTQGGLVLQHAAASTTAGYITLKIYNNTGGTFTWASTASSSIKYLDLK